MSRNEKLIAIFDSIRSEDFKGVNSCEGMECSRCPIAIGMNCSLNVDSYNKKMNIDHAIRLIDNYELPIKEYTLEELEKLPKGTMIEVAWGDKRGWFEREFIVVYKGEIITMTENGDVGTYDKARPIQEVK